MHRSGPYVRPSRWASQKLIRFEILPHCITQSFHKQKVSWRTLSILLVVANFQEPEAPVRFHGQLHCGGLAIDTKKTQTENTHFSGKERVLIVKRSTALIR